MKLVFTGKARNLERLRGTVKKSSVLDLLIFSTEDVKLRPDEVLRAIMQKFSGAVVVRSSSLNEDSEASSNAGAFLSVLNVPSCDKKLLNNALVRVCESMGSGTHELFIQPMLQNIICNGVAMSVGKEDSSPYYVVNYDESGASDGITSGNSTKHKTFYHFRETTVTAGESARFTPLIHALEELEELFSCSYLDVEFAFVRGEELPYILQVRPITIKREIRTQEVQETLGKMTLKLEKLNRTHPNLLGNKTIFGVMPDWNPAEIIGIKPRYLALSLYKELITDTIWAHQRSDYGYRDLRSHPLLVSFVGIPYVDTRISFNSFIPKNLHKEIASKLANFYLNKLAKAPHYHDKVEFEIILSCYHLCLEKRLSELEREGFSKEELKRLEFALLELTNRIIDPKEGLYRQDLKRAQGLWEKFQTIISSELADVDKIYWGIEYCKNYGTLPFAGVARAAFVAMQLLDSLVEIGFLSIEERGRFLESLNSISKRLSTDIYRLSCGEISKAEFLEEYGHLRSGTYSILSPTYKEAFESYFGDISSAKLPPKSHFNLSDERKMQLDNLLATHGLRITASELFIFIKEAIEGREEVKFLFTKVLSHVLEMIKHFGERLQIPAEELAHLDIKTLLSLYANLEGTTAKDRLLQDIAHHKREFELASILKLPPLIERIEDIYSYTLPASLPNFIGSARVSAEVVDEERDGLGGDMRGKIICIRSADPGYDFLFTKGIAGLITCYGGVNSHMAIRCAEARITAIIGAGEESFELWRKARFLEIDGATKEARILS